MMTIARSLGLALLILFSLSAHTAVYYVSTTGNDRTGAGTIDKPWRTIGYGMARMAGGDTLFIRGGAYEEPRIASSQIKNGLSNEQRTVIASYPGERAVLRTTTPGKNAFNSSMSRSVDYITFDGFTIDQSLAGEGSNLMKFYNANHVTLTNMHFLNSTRGSMTQFYSEPGTPGYPGGNVHVVGCLFSNMVNTATQSAASHFMYWSHHPNTIVENNVFLNATTLNPSLSPCALAITSTATNWIVRNNYMSNATYGIHFRGEDSHIYNNVLVNMRKSGIRARGRRNVYANNTVYAAPGIGTEYGVEDHHGQTTDRDSMDEVFINNIAWGSFSRSALESRSNVGQNRASYWTNNLANSSSFISGSVLHGNLVHPDYDPRFVGAPYDLRLASDSPARNAGVPISGLFSSDHDGFSRSMSSAWDIGAFEHGEFVMIDMVASMGEVQWPMTMSSEPLAPQDVNRSVAPGYVYSPVAGSGSVMLHFEVPAAGDYAVWCLTQSPSGFIDGVYVSMNGEEPDLYYPTEGSDPDGWYWSRVNGENTGLPYGIRLFRLEAGVNRIQFSTADAFVGLSRIMVTDDLNFVPEGAPRKGRAAPRVEIERNGDGTMLRWATVTNKNYHVFYKDDLRDAQWIRSRMDNPRVGSGNETEWMDLAGGRSGRFYLVYAAP